MFTFPPKVYRMLTFVYDGNVATDGDMYIAIALAKMC